MVAIFRKESTARLIHIAMCLRVLRDALLKASDISVAILKRCSHMVSEPLA